MSLVKSFGSIGKVSLFTRSGFTAQPTYFKRNASNQFTFDRSGDEPEYEYPEKTNVS